MIIQCIIIIILYDNIILLCYVISCHIRHHIIFIYMYLTTYYIPPRYIHTYEIILDWSTVHDHYCLHDHCCCYGLFHVFALTQPLVSPQARIEHLHQDLRDVLMEEAHRTWNTWNMHRTEKRADLFFPQNSVLLEVLNAFLWCPAWCWMVCPPSRGLVSPCLPLSPFLFPFVGWCVFPRPCLPCLPAGLPAGLRSCFP